MPSIGGVEQNYACADLAAADGSTSQGMKSVRLAVEMPSTDCRSADISGSTDLPATPAPWSPMHEKLAERLPSPHAPIAFHLLQRAAHCVSSSRSGIWLQCFALGALHRMPTRAVWRYYGASADVGSTLAETPRLDLNLI
jgi:hypothetical protein